MDIMKKPLKPMVNRLSNPRRLPMKLKINWMKKKEDEMDAEE